MGIPKILEFYHLNPSFMGCINHQNIGAFLKWYPLFIDGFSITNHKPSVLGYPHLWKSPYEWFTNCCTNIILIIPTTEVSSDCDPLSAVRGPWIRRGVAELPHWGFCQLKCQGFTMVFIGGIRFGAI